MKKIKHVVLEGSERYHLSGSRLIGVANPTEYIQITIKLRGRTELPDFNTRPEIILNHEELEKEYGANEKEMQKTVAVFESHGLALISSHPATKSIYMSGSVKSMEEVFNIKLMYYTHPENGDYRGRVGHVHIPVELKGIVVAVFGLDSRKMISKKRHPKLRSAINIADAVQRAWFFPKELAEKYNFPKGNGAGQSIGILEFGGGYFESDLKLFCKAANVPMPKIVPISVDHTSTINKDEAITEVMMDIEIVAGICPGATIPVYFGHFTERGWINILDKVIQDQTNKPSVLSISYGLAEGKYVWTEAAMKAINDLFKQAALLGMTICISSGDDGTDAQVGDGYAHVSFPASSPYVLSVGGTNLTAIKNKTHESVWKDGDGLRNDGGGSSGGGSSSFFPRPAWQEEINIESVNPGAIKGRLVPDTAAHAQTDGNTTGYFIVVEGQSSRNGGTSAAAPLWAALIGRINSLLQGGKKVGYLTPLLYKPLKSSKKTLGTLSCNDITEGNNISAAIGGYNAGKGYDAATGWGSPNGTELLDALNKFL